MVAMQSAAATASVKVRNSLDFFMGVVLLFKVRDRAGAACNAPPRTKAANSCGVMLRPRTSWTICKFSCSVFAASSSRSCFCSSAILPLVFSISFSMRSNLFIAIVIYSFLAFMVNARNNKNAVANSWNLSLHSRWGRRSAA